LTGSCGWDPEHGFGCTMHHCEMIEFGDPHAAISELIQPVDWEKPSFGAKPPLGALFVHPHPKYGKLKPSQQEMNVYFIKECLKRQQVAALETYLPYCVAYQPILGVSELQIWVDTALFYFSAPVLDVLLKYYPVLLAKMPWAATQEQQVVYLEGKGCSFQERVEGNLSVFDKLLEWNINSLLYELRTRRNSTFKNTDYGAQLDKTIENRFNFIPYLLKRGGQIRSAWVKWDVPDPDFLPIRRLLLRHFLGLSS
jgi:hypothetical protein